VLEIKDETLAKADRIKESVVKLIVDLPNQERGKVARMPHAVPVLYF
jgi:hypothetical protein